MSHRRLKVFRGIYSFVIALMAAIPFAEVVFFTTKPLAFLEDWQIVAFAVQCTAAFLLTISVAKDFQKRRVGFVGGSFIAASIITGAGFCFWHRHYLNLPRIGSFDFLPLAFVLIPTPAIFAALYARHADTKTV